MKPLHHTSALGWIIALSAVGWLVAGLMVIVSLPRPESGGFALAVGTAGFFLAILVPSVVGAIVLHGVKQMLTQVRDPEPLVERPTARQVREARESERVRSLQDRAEESRSSREGGAAQGPIGDAGVDLRGGDGGVPEQPLDR